MKMRELIDTISKNENDPEPIKVADFREAIEKIEVEDDDVIVGEDAGALSLASTNSPSDRYQEKPKKRTRYQNGNDSRWQTPRNDTKPKSPPK